LKLPEPAATAAVDGLAPLVAAPPVALPVLLPPAAAPPVAAPPVVVPAAELSAAAADAPQPASVMTAAAARTIFACLYLMVVFSIGAGIRGGSGDSYIRLVPLVSLTLTDPTSPSGCDRAIASGVNWARVPLLPVTEEIAEHYTQAFFADLGALNASRSPGYGALALIDIEGQREAARGEQLPGRRRKTDFALWRTDEPGQRRIMRWDSPWGPGVPGWHLECSVMSMALLGEHFDIHTGGVDHRELHYVNEIAQSEAYLSDGQPWIHYWLHGEFLQLGAQKMAKSAGGAPRLADLTEVGYHPMAFRLFLLGGHYRSQLDFTPAAMDTAQATLRRLVTRIAPLRPLPAFAGPAFAGPGAAGPAAVGSGAVDPVAARLFGQIDAAIGAWILTQAAILEDGAIGLHYRRA
jgi:tRNA synthetases class I (C) catalytic domain